MNNNHLYNLLKSTVHKEVIKNNYSQKKYQENQIEVIKGNRIEEQKKENNNINMFNLLE